VLAELSFVDLDLSGGAFAPGATPEAEGASEIEIERAQTRSPQDAAETASPAAPDQTRSAHARP